MNSLLISIVLIILLTLLIMWYMCSYKEGHTNNKQLTGERRLFLLPESKGFEVKDIVPFKNSAGTFLLDPDIVKKNFDKIAVVMNYAGNIKDGMWSSPPIEKLLDETKLPIEKWITFYFGMDDAPVIMKKGELKGGVNGGYCNDGMRTKKQIMSGVVPYSDISCNSVVVDNIFKAVNTYGATGIMFDDEVGSTQHIVKAMELVKDKYDIANKKTGKTLKLGWTFELSSGKKTSPGNFGQYNWDFCLGQAYTDTTVDIYKWTDSKIKDEQRYKCSMTSAETLSFTKNFWHTVETYMQGVTDSERGVPMVCAAGNCQGDVSKLNPKTPTKSNPLGFDCDIDERISGATISAIIQNRPPLTIYKNFAIWYGTFGDISAGGCKWVGKQSNDSCQNDGWKWP
jgi:hypothetical protein